MISPKIGRAIVNSIREALCNGQIVRLRVVSGSMRPAIKPGDTITVYPVEPDDIALGEIICFSPVPGVIYGHRLVRREGDMLVTKGDANEQEDNPIPIGALLGVVKEVIS